MRAVITGGAGFLGTLVGRRLLERGDEVVVVDTRAPEPRRFAERVEVVVADLADGPALRGAVDGADSVFHLASMVSAEAERDPDGALAVNLHGTLAVLDACRAQPTPPRLVFASSVAVFGGEAGADRVGDTTKQTPGSTYGMTKAIGELLVDEWTRKGFVDGRSARLPTVIVRPGAPNAAASGFASGMFREPLAGVDAVVPVDPSTRMCLIGTRSAVAGLVALADLDGAALGRDRAVGLPALEVTVADMLAALERAGRRHWCPLGRIEVRPDPAVEAVVASWPGAWDASRALALGLPGDESLDSVIADHLADLALG